jgi:hypothetical protein
MNTVAIYITDATRFTKASLCQQFEISCRQGNIKRKNMQKCHLAILTYEGEWVNMSQMDIKRKTCDIRTCKKIFLDTSSTNPDTLAPSLYQCVETRSIGVFWLMSQGFQPLRHQRNFCHPDVNHFTRQTFPTVNRKHFFMNILFIESFFT